MLHCQRKLHQNEPYIYLFVVLCSNEIHDINRLLKCLTQSWFYCQCCDSPVAWPPEITCACWTWTF